MVTEVSEFSLFEIYIDLSSFRSDLSPNAINTWKENTSTYGELGKLFMGPR